MNIQKSKRNKNVYHDFRLSMLEKSRDKVLVSEIFNTIETVKKDGEEEILRYYKQKAINRKNVFVSKKEINKAIELIGKTKLGILQKFMFRAAEVADKQASQISEIDIIQNGDGFNSELCHYPLNVIGLYIPRNLPSSLIYYCELAKRAGVKKIILALPPENNGTINPYLLVAAHLVGVENIVAIGGMRALPFLAFGVKKSLRPDKIFGPSSFYVDLVKQFLSVFYKIPIDIASGPTEMSIYIDDPEWSDQVITDLSAQIEHGPDSKCFVFTPSNFIYRKLSKKLNLFTVGAVQVFLVDKLEEAFMAINDYSPEILEIFSKKPKFIVSHINNASNIYINTCSPLGDYLVAGKGCADPTFGMSRGDSGITIRSFLKTKCTTEANEDLLNMKLINMAKNMADIESLKNHKRSIEFYELCKRNQKTRK